MSETSGPKDGNGSAGRDAKPVDPIIGEAVGSRLKSLFDEFASEDVPDRFKDLIEQLERSEEADKDGGGPISTRDAGSAAKGTGKADT